MDMEPRAPSSGAALDFAKTLVSSCSRVLGDAIAGVILHGSLATSGYLPGQSDIDLLVIVNDRLSDDQIDALVAEMTTAQIDAPAPIDLRVINREAASSPTRAPFMDAYFRITPGQSGLLVETRHAEPDLVIELFVCRTHGRPLLGPAPPELIAEVPRRLVLHVDDQQLAHWQDVGDDPEHAELTVLTACRIWQFVEEGRHSSKAAAAQWVLARKPGLQVVRDALRHRQVDATVAIDGIQVQELLALARTRVKEKLC